MPTSTQLTRFRAVAEASFDKTYTRMAKNEVKSGTGGMTTTYVSTGSAVACKLSALISGDETMFGNKVNPDANFRLDYPVANSLNEKDRIRINSIDYEITNVAEGYSYAVTHVAALKKLG